MFGYRSTVLCKNHSTKRRESDNSHYCDSLWSLVLDIPQQLSPVSRCPKGPSPPCGSSHVM